MVNINKLKGKMVEKSINVAALAAAMGLNHATVYRKFETGNFSIKEAKDIARILDLSIDEVNSIFFADVVA